jgi:hypothetical protein
MSYALLLIGYNIITSASDSLATGASCTAGKPTFDDDKENFFLYGWSLNSYSTRNEYFHVDVSTIAPWNFKADPTALVSRDYQRIKQIKPNVETRIRLT